jgi:hypothetical protein
MIQKEMLNHPWSPETKAAISNAAAVASKAERKHDQDGM